MSSDTNHSRKI